MYAVGSLKNALRITKKFETRTKDIISNKNEDERNARIKDK